MGLSVLGYRPWQGTLRTSWRSPWPISRIALKMLLRRKLFWGLYLIALFHFMIFFSGIYLLSQIDFEMLTGASRDIVGFWQGLVDTLRKSLYMAGTAETYRNFIWLQGYIVMAMLALAGSVLIGNDYQYGTLPFYLSKPLGRWNYLCGKFLAVALFVNMTTTLPALILYVECGLLDGWEYYEKNLRILWGILGYGAVLTVCLSLLMLAVASWLRKTVPLVMVWTGFLFFTRLFSGVLVGRLGYDPRWRLIDLWNNMYVVGSEFLGTEAKIGLGRRMVTANQPEPWEAAVVLGVVCVVCLVYLNRRIQAVEVVQ